MDSLKLALLKEDQEQKEPYTDTELKKLLRKPKSGKWQEWRCWAIVNVLLATGMRANTVIHLKISDINFHPDLIGTTINETQSVSKKKTVRRTPVDSRGFT